MVPPKEIAPLLALVLMLLDPAKVAATALVIVKELAVMLAPIETVLPAADEISTAPSLVVPPTTPVKVIAPDDPAFKVRA